MCLWWRLRGLAFPRGRIVPSPTGRSTGPAQKAAQAGYLYVGRHGRSIKNVESVVSFGSLPRAASSAAAPVASLAATGHRPTFAAATSSPRGVSGGGFFPRSARCSVPAHCEAGVGRRLWWSLAAGWRRRLLSAVLVPALAGVRCRRLTLAGAFRFGGSAAGVSALASAAAPLVASARARLSARSHRPQPNNTFKRTCAKSRAGRLTPR